MLYEYAKDLRVGPIAGWPGDGDAYPCGGTFCEKTRLRKEDGGVL